MAALKKKTNPFVAEDADDAIDRPAPRESPGNDTDPEVNLDEPEDEEPAEPRESRDDRRRNRAWMNREEKERLEREAAEARAAAAQAQAAAAQALQFAQQQAYRQQQPQPVDPIDQAEAQVMKERDLLHKEYAQRYAEASRRPITPEEQASFEKRAQELEGRHVDVRMERKLRQLGIGGQANPQVEALKAHISMNYPEVVSNPQAVLLADGLQKQFAAQGRNPWALDTINEVMTQTEKTLRLGKYRNGAPQTPDPVLRDRLQGPPRGGTGGQQDAPRTVKMTKEYRRMADKAFPHLPEAKRYEKFAREVIAAQDDD